MYRVYCDNEPIYDPRDDELVMTEAKMSLGVNVTGEFVFSLPPTHPYIENIQKLKSVIKVYDDKELLYVGRVLNTSSNLYNVKKFTCEGDMAYLLDSIQRPTEYHDLTPESYLADKIAQHNSQVEEEKRFVLGTVEKQEMNYDARQDNQYTNTLDTIMDKLIDSNGGYIVIRHEEGKRYLDYLESYGRTSSQVIRFGENILDLTEHISAANVTTVLIPLGKSEEAEETGTGGRVTIETVNDGKDYLEDLEAIALYGRITRTHTWDEVTVPENLKKKGEDYLETARNLSMTIDLTAVDLHMIDVDIDKIKCGDMIRTVSPPHGLDRYMLVSKREYNLLSPSNDRIVLGDTQMALADTQADLKKSIEKQNDAIYSVENIKSSVKTLEGEMKTAKEDVSGLDNRVVSLEEEGSKMQDKVQILEKNAEDVASDMSDLKSDSIELQGKIQEILQRLEALEGGDGV